MPKTGFPETPRNSYNRQIRKTFRFSPRLSDITRFDRGFKRKKEEEDGEDGKNGKSDFKAVKKRIKVEQRKDKGNQNEEMQCTSSAETEFYRTEANQKIDRTHEMVDEKKNRAGKEKAEKIGEAQKKEIEFEVRG